MGYMIEISDSKIEKMGEYVEDMLWAGGELMHCLEKMKGEEHGYGHRGGSSRYSGGSNYGSRGGSMGYRDDEDWDEMDERRDDMMERRGRRRRDSRGRYM